MRGMTLRSRNVTINKSRAVEQHVLLSTRASNMFAQADSQAETPSMLPPLATSRLQTFSAELM